MLIFLKPSYFEKHFQGHLLVFSDISVSVKDDTHMNQTDHVIEIGVGGKLRLCC